MKTVTTLSSYCVDGKIKNSKYTSEVEDVDKLFDNTISDAELIAKNVNGRIDIMRTDRTLYISYLDIPNSALVDVIIIANI